MGKGGVGWGRWVRGGSGKEGDVGVIVFVIEKPL